MNDSIEIKDLGIFTAKSSGETSLIVKPHKVIAPPLVRKLIGQSPHVWVTGSAASYLAGRTSSPPRDYDIVCTDINEYHLMISLLTGAYPIQFNTFGGPKITLPDISIDFWFDDLGRLLIRSAVTEAYNFVTNKYWSVR